jgi:hypothetical protein
MSPIVAVALVQVVLLVGLAWSWSGDTDKDATATTVDWGFVALILATPTVLAGSFLVGRLVKRRTSDPSSRLGRGFARTVQVTTLVLLVPTLLLALPLAAVAILIEPIG